VAADFLRDSLRLPPTLDKASRRIRELGGLDRRGRLEPVLPGLYQAIVDEADSVLIDEAVTPLILSARGDNQALVQAVRWSVETAGTWEEGREYRLLPRYREVELTRAGRESLAGLPSGARGILGSAARREEMVRTALAARAYHLRGKHYLVSEGKITIVDEFTGRPMPDRSWRQGIQQAVELGEGLEPSPPAETVARISFQGFFRLYHRRSGMTGTGREVAGEFWRIYGMPFVEIPRQRPCRRVYLPTRWFGGASDKADAIIRRALSLCAEGRAVLIGTRTERDCEHLEQLARAAGHPVSALNARRVAEEAAIIRQAGESGRLTIATNMAGRGTDILLDKRVREAGGLHVIASEFHEARRIDRQLIGRCARQGDPGSCETFASLEDQLVQHFGTALEKLALASRCRGGEGDPGPAGGRILRRCQVRAERLAHQRREAVLRHDIWLRENLTFAGAEHG
jgi:preprotein translocase subunit SecA